MCCLVKYVVFQHYSLLFSGCIKGTIFFNTYSFVPAFMQTTLMFLKVSVLYFPAKGLNADIYTVTEAANSVKCSGARSVLLCRISSFSALV